jgi:hypothetical protein
MKKLIVWACVAAAAYFILSTHFIFVGGTPRILKKSNLTLEYTFFSTQGKTNESILKVDKIRKAGIGPLLVQMGRMTESELERLTNKIEEAEENEKAGSRK